MKLHAFLFVLAAVFGLFSSAKAQYVVRPDQALVFRSLFDEDE
jgi:hypothetical protein